MGSPAWNIQCVAGFACSEPNSEFSSWNSKSKPSKTKWKYPVFSLVFPAFTWNLCVSSSSSCALVERQRCLLELFLNQNIFVEFMASFPFNLNSLPQPPVCGVEIILLPYLVSLINAVEHSDSDKQPRKAQRKWKILSSEQCLDSWQEIRLRHTLKNEATPKY